MVNTVVHVKIQEEWDFVSQILSYNWNYVKFSKNYSQCINLSSNLAGSLDFYKQRSYNIISFEEFCNLKNIINPFKPQYELW